MTFCNRRILVSLVMSLAISCDLFGPSCVNGEINIFDIESARIIQESDVSHKSRDDYLMNLDNAGRRNLCIRMQRETDNIAFPRKSRDFYVPNAHYYDFGKDVSDRWAAIRCPFVPIFYVSRGRIQIKKGQPPPVWKVLLMPLKINYTFDLESARAVTLLSTEHSSDALRATELSYMTFNQRFECCRRAAQATRYGFIFSSDHSTLIGEPRLYEFDHTDWKQRHIAYACPTRPSMYLRVSDFDLLAPMHYWNKREERFEVGNPYRNQRTNKNSFLTIVILENDSSVEGVWKVEGSGNADADHEDTPEQS